MTINGPFILYYRGASAIISHSIYRVSQELYDAYDRTDKESPEMFELLVRIQAECKRVAEFRAPEYAEIAYKAFMAAYNEQEMVKPIWYVRGGVHVDTTFEKIAEGFTEEVHGPLTYDDAHKLWRARTSQTIDTATARFFIVKDVHHGASESFEADVGC